MKSNFFHTAMEAIDLLRKRYRSRDPHSDNLDRLKAYLTEKKDQPLGHYPLPEELLSSAQFVLEEAFKDDTVGTARDAIKCYKLIKTLEDIYHPRLFNSPN